MVGGAKFSLAASESVVIVEMSAFVPKPSCLTCLESRELKLGVDGGETTEVGGGSGWGAMEGVSATWGAAGCWCGGFTAVILVVSSFRWWEAASFSH